ncbi:MAG: hypothetical protein RL745_780 [Actinomycetota bacterium]|jgi:homoserine kinase
MSVSRVHVRVGATSANLGAGFDSLGLAWHLYDDIRAEVTPAGDSVVIKGEGADNLPTGATHLILSTIRRELDSLGADVPGLRLRCRNRIPQSRGLGSSAAATVAAHAIVAALTTPASKQIDRDRVFAAAARDEGHPDNVAPCVFGGLTVSWLGSDGIADCASLSVHPAAVFTCVIPQSTSATAKARAVLPAEVPMADAVFNIAHASAMVAALTLDPDLLLPAMDDRLHENRRRRQWPASYGLVQQLRAVGVPACISGAGPTVLAAYPRSGATKARRTIAMLAPATARVLHTRIDADGVQITRS